MKPRLTITNFLLNIQKKLFPILEEEIGPLTEKQQKLIKILEMIRIEAFVKINRGYRGRPEDDRQSIARAFVARSVYNISETKELRERILSDKSLRQICGWDSKNEVPSESTFSRAFNEFSMSELPQRVHKALIERDLSNQLIGHISRDSTAIEVREKPHKSTRKSKKKKKKNRRGRPKKGEIREKELSRLEKQRDMSLDEMLEELPKKCDIGNKTDSKGYKRSWTGYKFHIDASDGDIPISCLLTSASVHDSQAAMPLAEMTNNKITNLYDIMDSAYDSPIIREHSKSLNHVPIIDINPRRNKALKSDLRAEAKRLNILNIKKPEALRYNERNSVERVNARLKDEFGGRIVRVRGHPKVIAHLMFGILALTADQLFRLVT